MISIIGSTQMATRTPELKVIAPKADRFNYDPLRKGNRKGVFLQSVKHNRQCTKAHLEAQILFAYLVCEESTFVFVDSPHLEYLLHIPYPNSEKNRLSEYKEINRKYWVVENEDYIISAISTILKHKKDSDEQAIERVVSALLDDLHDCGEVEQVIAVYNKFLKEHEITIQFNQYSEYTKILKEEHNHKCDVTYSVLKPLALADEEIAAILTKNAEELVQKIYPDKYKAGSVKEIEASLKKNEDELAPKFYPEKDKTDSDDSEENADSSSSEECIRILGHEKDYLLSEALEMFIAAAIRGDTHIFYAGKLGIFDDVRKKVYGLGSTKAKARTINRCPLNEFFFSLLEGHTATSVHTINFPKYASESEYEKTWMNRETLPFLPITTMTRKARRRSHKENEEPIALQEPKEEHDMAQMQRFEYVRQPSPPVAIRTLKKNPSDDEKTVSADDEKTVSADSSSQDSVSPSSSPVKTYRIPSEALASDHMEEESYGPATQVFNGPNSDPRSQRRNSDPMEVSSGPAIQVFNSPNSDPRILSATDTATSQWRNSDPRDPGPAFDPEIYLTTTERGVKAFGLKVEDFLDDKKVKGFFTYADTVAQKIAPSGATAPTRAANPHTGRVGFFPPAPTTPITSHTEAPTSFLESAESSGPRSHQTPSSGSFLMTHVTKQ